MPYVLETPSLQLLLFPELGRWSLFSRDPRGPALERLRVRVVARRGRANLAAPLLWEPLQVDGPHVVPSPHGLLRQLQLRVGPTPEGMRLTLTFALPERSPFLLWRLAVENVGPGPLYLDRLELLNGAFPDGRIHLGGPEGDLAAFVHGWQSWSWTGAQVRHQRRTRLGPLTAPLWINAGTPPPRAPDHFVSNFFGALVDRRGRRGLLAGFLAERRHFGVVELWTDSRRPGLILWAQGDGVRLEPGEAWESEPAILLPFGLDDPDPLAPFVEAVAREHGLGPVDRPLPLGWCSWYQFFQDVTAGDVGRNLAAMEALAPDLPLRILQIDDGYQAAVGDWERFSPAFPEGVAGLAREIRAAGFVPGLWLAPFVAHPRSRLVRDHPDWLLRDRRGRPVNAGFVWNAFVRALDLTHPDAFAYACEAVHRAVHRWGFPYLKLDFLYAAALPGRRRAPNRTRAQVLRTALAGLRAAAGREAFLLGCGVPLGPALGLVDAVRVGADVAPHWRPRFLGLERPFRREGEMPAARNALQNALTRSFLHRRWWINDPDCLLVRPDADLTAAEVQTLVTLIGASGGSLFLSDDLTRLSPERLRWAQLLLPPLDRRPRILDLFDAEGPSRIRLDLEGPEGPWHLLIWVNWDDRPRTFQGRLGEFGLPGGLWWVRELWRGISLALEGEALPAWTVPAHGVLCLALRRRTEGPRYVGSDLHLSQGIEIRAWEASTNRLRFRLGLGRRAEGHVELALPAPPREVRWQGRPEVPEETGAGTWRLPVRLDPDGEGEGEVLW